MGNPCMDPSGDLLVLDTRVVADCTIVESVQTIENLWQQRCDGFYQDRLIARTKQLNDTITKANLPVFHRHVHKDKSRQQNQVKALKVTEPCFPPPPYIACQVRHTDMADFFSHETQSYPPSLSNHGALRSGTKSDLLVCVYEVNSNRHISYLMYKYHKHQPCLLNKQFTWNSMTQQPYNNTEITNIYKKQDKVTANDLVPMGLRNYHICWFDTLPMGIG